MTQQQSFEEQIDQLWKDRKQILKDRMYAIPEPIEGIQIITLNCCYDYTHPQDQFKGFKVYYKGKDVSGAWTNKKPPIDWLEKGKVTISDTLCDDCARIEYDKYGLEYDIVKKQSRGKK